jgi:DNA-binding NtrC family response regulator
MTATINQSLNILFVDDEVNLRKALSVCIKAEGHQMIAVSHFQGDLTEA